MTSPILTRLVGFYKPRGVRHYSSWCFWLDAFPDRVSSADFGFMSHECVIKYPTGNNHGYPGPPLISMGVVL